MGVITLTLSLTAGIPDVPAIAWVRPNTDNTPTFRVTVTGEDGDGSYIQYGTSAIFAGATEVVTGLTSAILATGYYDYITPELADGTYYIRARNSRLHSSGVSFFSDWSNTDSETISYSFDGTFNFANDENSMYVGAL